jgi:hypothetical protein
MTNKWFVNRIASEFIFVGQKSKLPGFKLKYSP